MTTRCNPFGFEVPEDGPLLAWFMEILDNMSLYPTDDAALWGLLQGSLTDALEDPVFGVHLYRRRRKQDRCTPRLHGVKVWDAWCDVEAWGTWYTGLI